jgi:hypothetical protein
MAGCNGTEEASPDLPASSPSAGASSVTQASAGGWGETIAAGSQDPAKAAAGPRPPDPKRDPEDLVAGCSGMHPEQRPRGSNCFGIFPEQCGADLAARHIGELMTPTLATRLEEIAPGGARIIRPMQAVHDDLRHARLNVLLDEQDRVTEVDCY